MFRHQPTYSWHQENKTQSKPENQPKDRQCVYKKTAMQQASVLFSARFNKKCFASPEEKIQVILCQMQVDNEKPDTARKRAIADKASQYSEKSMQRKM